MGLKLKSYRLLMTPEKCEKQNDSCTLERENVCFFFFLGMLQGKYWCPKMAVFICDAKRFWAGIETNE